MVVKQLLVMPTHGLNERDGLGADFIIDAAGSSITLKIALQLVRPNGHITKVGWGPQPLGFSLDPLVQKNVTLQGSFSHNWPIWEKVISLAGQWTTGCKTHHRWRMAHYRMA